jgi:RecJ-like exonuclease
MEKTESGEIVKLCGACNGSGEGMRDGTICRECKGKGVVKDSERPMASLAVLRVAWQHLEDREPAPSGPLKSPYSAPS